MPYNFVTCNLTQSDHSVWAEQQNKRMAVLLTKAKTKLAKVKMGKGLETGKYTIGAAKNCVVVSNATVTDDRLLDIFTLGHIRQLQEGGIMIAFFLDDIFEVDDQDCILVFPPKTKYVDIEKYLDNWLKGNADFLLRQKGD